MVNHWLNAAAFEKLSLFVTFRYRMLERMASCFRTLVRSAGCRLVAQSSVRDSWGRCRPSFREDAVMQTAGNARPYAFDRILPSPPTQQVAGRRREGPSAGWRLQHSSVGKSANPGLTPGAFPLPATVWARAPGRGRSSYNRIVAGESGTKVPNNYSRWTAMNGERYPREILPFEPSMAEWAGRLQQFGELLISVCLAERSQNAKSFQCGTARLTL